MTNLTLTQIKKFSKQQGYKSQNAFADVVKLKQKQRKELRQKNAVMKFSDSQERIMYSVTPEQMQDLALRFVELYSRISKSYHASREFATKYSSGIVEYARSAHCRALEFNNIAVKLIGNTITSKTFFRGKLQIEIFKVWFNRHTRIVDDANLDDKIAVYKNEQLCIMRSLETGKKTGYAVKNIDETWSHGQTLRDAVNEKIRQEAIARQKNLATRKHHLVKLFCKNWAVTRDDSYYAGNCRIGTESFLKEQNLQNVKFINSQTLEQLAQNNERAKRVYDYAIDLIARY